MTTKLKLYGAGLILLFVVGAAAILGYNVGHSAGTKESNNSLNTQLVQALKDAKQARENLGKTQEAYATLSSSFATAQVDLGKAQAAVADFRSNLAYVHSLRAADRKEFERKLAGVESTEKLRGAVQGYEDNLAGCTRHVERFATEAADYSGKLANKVTEVKSLENYIETRKRLELERKQLANSLARN